MKRYFVVKIGNIVSNERIIRADLTLIRTRDKEKCENYFNWRAKECPKEHLELRFMSIGEGDDHVEVLKSRNNGVLEENGKKMTIPETLVEASSSPVEPL